MKKYIFIILSFGLFSLPLGTFARVESGDCSKHTDATNCDLSKGCGWNYDTNSCELCPAGKYNTDNSADGCNNCYLPKGASFRQGDYTFQGMTSPTECPWSITCGENTQIRPGAWSNGTQCTPCDTGYQKPNGTSQYWDGNTMTGACTPKTYIIHARIIFPEDCGNYKTGNPTHTFTYTADSNIYTSFLTIIYATGSGVDQTKYSYPTSGTKFDLSPINYGGPTVTLVLTGDYLTFDNSSQDFNDIAFYPNGQEFNMDITLVEKNPTYIYYCPSQFTNSGAQSGICKATTYNKCNKPMAPDLSDNSIFNVGSPDCSKGQYANSWKLLHPSNLTSYNWTASNNPVINFGDTIILPSDTNSTYFYMAPNFTNCPSGTYNDNVTCPTNCESCPTGFTSDTGAASKTDCYIDTTMTFNDKNGTSNTIISSPVYYVGNQ